MTTGIQRRRWCEHATTWRTVQSTLNRVWCPECEDLVECEFKL